MSDDYDNVLNGIEKVNGIWLTDQPIFLMYNNIQEECDLNKIIKKGKSISNKA